MSQDLSRRGFMKAASATAGVMVATGFSPLSYAQNEKVAIANGLAPRFSSLFAFQSSDILHTGCQEPAP